MCKSNRAHLDRTLQPPDLPYLLSEIEGSLQDTSLCSLQSKYSLVTFVH